MANKKITGKAIELTDYQDKVSWTGKTKDGREVIIELENAINLENIDWTLAEKDEVVSAVTYTATYLEENADTDKEPWSITYVTSTGTRGTRNPNEILLGYGVFKIGSVAVGVTRGGGQFVVEREYREIVVDGDKGPVKDRIVKDTSRAKLTMNVLEIIGDNIPKLYPGVSVTDVTI